MTAEQQVFCALEPRKYFGQWVAICGDEVIATDKNFKTVYDKAKSHCAKRPFIAKMPERGTMIF
jgi:hypothetical protein